VDKVDSMYLKNEDWFDISLRYNSSNQLVKYTRYGSGVILIYWTIVTDDNDNVVKAEDYWNNGALGYSKETNYTFTRDAKKNPLAGNCRISWSLLCVAILSSAENNLITHLSKISSK
jgi:hypothetical protein